MYHKILYIEALKKPIPTRLDQIDKARRLFFYFRKKGS